MSGGDWFRREQWTPTIAAEFERRLSRARRRRGEYLAIQALTLAATEKPEVALPAVELARRQLQLDADGIRAAQMHATIARAFTTTGDLDAATDAYRQAVERERSRPNVRGYHYLDYAWFAATRGLSDLYDEVLEAMQRNRSDRDLLFPLNRFRYFGALAMISAHHGDAEHARQMARNALAAAAATVGPSGQALGLVPASASVEHERLSALAR